MIGLRGARRAYCVAFFQKRFIAGDCGARAWKVLKASMAIAASNIGGDVNVLVMGSRGDACYGCIWRAKF